MPARRSHCEAQAKGRELTGSRPAILVVNKIDQTQSFALSKAQLDAASKLRWHLIQTSAKSGANAAQAFTKLARLMVEARKATE